MARQLSRKDYDSLRQEIYREADRLNKQITRAARQYGVNSPVYRDIERNIVELVQATGSYIMPYYEGSHGERKISLSNKNIDTLTKSSIANNTYIRNRITASKKVTTTSLIAKYQEEVNRVTGENMFASKLRERREVVKAYEKIEIISESHLWSTFGSEMGNAKKAKTDKLVLELLLDLSQTLNIPLDDEKLFKIFELWKVGTDVHKLSNEEIEQLEGISYEKKENDEEYQSFIND